MEEERISDSDRESSLLWPLWSQSHLQPLLQRWILVVWNARRCISPYMSHLCFCAFFVIVTVLLVFEQTLFFECFSNLFPAWISFIAHHSHNLNQNLILHRFDPISSYLITFFRSHLPFPPFLFRQRHPLSPPLHIFHLPNFLHLFVSLVLIRVLKYTWCQIYICRSLIILIRVSFFLLLLCRVFVCANNIYLQIFSPPSWPPYFSLSNEPSIVAYIYMINSSFSLTYFTAHTHTLSLSSPILLHVCAFDISQLHEFMMGSFVFSSIFLATVSPSVTRIKVLIVSLFFSNFKAIFDSFFFQTSCNLLFI